MGGAPFIVRAASLALMLLLGACSPARAPSEEPTVEPSAVRPAASAHSPSPAAAAGWVEPAAYAFTLDSRCGERDFIGRFAVDVKNGVVVAVEGLDERGQTATSVVQPADVPSLADLVALAAKARRDGADQVRVVTDPADGHPVSVEMDWIAAAIDEEECYTVSDFVVGE